MIKSTYGTGCFVLMNTGAKKMVSKSNLLATTAYKLDTKKSFALEGSIFNAGTVVRMRDELNFISNRNLDEKYYQTVFAKNIGAAASPTAGLHFTKDLIMIGVKHRQEYK